MKKYLIRIYYWINRKRTTDYIWKLREKAGCGGVLGLFFAFQYYRIIERMNSAIPLSTVFDNKPVFPHGISNIYISKDAHIGKNCVIFQQVTIGSNSLSDSKGFGAPEIGDNVYIGAGAKIIGGIRILDNVRIGANCVVVTDIPSNSTVVLEHPRIISR